MDTMNLKPQTSPDQGTWLRRVQTAAADHDRTRRVLDGVIAEATAAGVPVEELEAVGPGGQGHGRHASGELDLNGATESAQADSTGGPISDDAAPVVVGPLIPGELGREVLVQHGSGRPGSRLCTDQEDLRAFLETERPGTDLRDPRQVQWANRPGEWVAS